MVEIYYLITKKDDTYEDGINHTTKKLPENVNESNFKDYPFLVKKQDRYICIF